MLPGYPIEVYVQDRIQMLLEDAARARVPAPASAKHCLQTVVRTLLTWLGAGVKPQGSPARDRRGVSARPASWSCPTSAPRWR